MKPLFAAAVLAVALSNNGVAAPEPETDAAKVERALETWSNLKEQCGGNYSYTVRFSSFAGFGHVTTVVVRDNEVAERRFERFTTRPVLPGENAPKKEGWVETGKEIGKHEEGAPGRTLDELYKSARKIAEANLPQFTKRYVRTDKQGLLTSCFTVDTRIADDAPRNGIVISTITLKASERE